MTDPRLQLANAAAAAWASYSSTVQMGGTPEQREWAFGHALTAETRLAEHEGAQVAADLEQLPTTDER